MSDANSDMVVIEGREYPSRYAPGMGSKDLDKAWEILDSIKPGVLSVQARSFLAGQITGALMAARKEGKDAGASSSDKAAG